jgi:hypothetical protein
MTVLGPVGGRVAKVAPVATHRRSLERIAVGQL